MKKTILETSNLTKTYKKLVAVNKLSLKIEEQMIYGLLGPNGSGKTTTLGMLLGVTRPTSGSFSWFDNGTVDENRKRIGSLLETPNFYPYMTAVQNLEVVAKIKDLKNPSEEIERVLKVVNLFDRKKSKFSTFSLGMKQRLAIASTLLGNPEVLVLDEPTNGLDPQGIAEIRELIIDIAKSGKTIIIASHILDEIEKTCTHCAIIKNGDLLRTGTIAEIIGNQDAALIRIGSESPNKLIKIVNAHPELSIYKELESSLIVKAKPGTKPSEINALFFNKGETLNQLDMFNESLENQFLEIVKK